MNTTVEFVVVYENGWTLEFPTEADARKAYVRDMAYCEKHGEDKPIRIERVTVDRVTLEAPDA